MTFYIAKLLSSRKVIIFKEIKMCFFFWIQLISDEGNAQCAENLFMRGNPRELFMVSNYTSLPADVLCHISTKPTFSLSFASSQMMWGMLSATMNKTKNFFIFFNCALVHSLGKTFLLIALLHAIQMTFFMFSTRQNKTSQVLSGEKLNWMLAATENFVPVLI